MASGITVVNIARPTTRKRIWNNLREKSLDCFPSEGRCSIMFIFLPSNKCRGIDVPVSHSWHGHYHAVNALKVTQTLLVFKQRRIPVVFNHVDEARRRPPDGNEHGNKLEKSENILRFWHHICHSLSHLIDLAVSRIFKYCSISGKELSLSILRHLRPIQTLPSTRETKEGGMVKKSTRE